MSEHTRARQVPIAIVGVSALFPGSADVGRFWRNLLEGRDLLSDVPPSHWLIEDYYDPDPSKPDKTYGRRGGFLPAVDFDPLAFGVPPANLPATDSAQLLALIVAQQVLEDATQGQFAKLNRERASVVLGVCGAQELVTELVGRLQRPVWLKALREAGIDEPKAQEICERIASNYVPWQEASFPGLLGNVVAGRIANKFDLHGTNCVTDAACASALSALSMSINELALGHSDLVITGGVDTMNDPFTYMCFSKTPALSPSGDCRPFSDASDGTMLGEGLAMFALKRLADAERDGDRVYAVIRGLGSASDGQGTAIYAPAAKGQARALQRAYESAGYGPETVELVEAHGTGTKAGDVAEFDGLRAVFDNAGRDDHPWCALGSVKSQIGHTKAAAGAAGLLKIVLALHHKVLLPTLKVGRPNPKLDIETSPFYLNTQARPWIRDAAQPRRASVSSFGFGGSNFHATVEEYRPQGQAKSAWALHAWPSELVVLGASNAASLAARAWAIAAERAPLMQVARESQLAFDADAPVRLALVAADADELARQLVQAAAAIEAGPQQPLSSPAGWHYEPRAPRADGIAFLFSGQGSQYVGMGAELAMHLPQARAAWDAAAAHRYDGEALHRVVFPLPAFDDDTRRAQAERLTATEWAQPALAAQSLALLGVLRTLGVEPACVAGHSFGELVALHCASAFDADTLLQVARRRGELMRDAAASGAGAMVAVSCSRAELERALPQLGELGACVANDNAPNQVVLSGTLAAIEAVEQRLADARIASTRLKVSTAFHSPLVAPAVGPLREFLGGVELQAPRLPVFGNTDAAPYPSDVAALREQLAVQLAQPVRFVETIEAMHARGARTFVEIGAGHTLADLAGRILEGCDVLTLSLDRKGRHGVSSLLHALARLAVQGVRLNFAPLWADCAPPVAKKKSGMTVSICGTNPGKPYPPPGGASALPSPNEPAPPALQTPAPVVPAAPAGAVPANGAWLDTLLEMQRSTAEAHAAFQHEMAESHRAFLTMVGSASNGWETMLAGSGTPTASIVAPVERAPEIVIAPPAVAPARAPVVVLPSAPVQRELASLVLAVVADKTGYPVEMLSAEMALEADLGIDSIKRVEILSQLREQLPGLPELKPAELGRLRTIGDIVDQLRGSTVPATTPAPAAAPAQRDLLALVLAVVADKTGYPVEMLSAEMALEADLGIDSIKRVEILSKLREQLPDLPELKPAELGRLRTIADIAAQLRGSDAPAAGSQAPQQPLSRAIVQVRKAPASGLAMAGLAGGTIGVVDAGSGIAAAVVQRLRDCGVDAAVVDSAVGTDGGVVFLGGLREVEPSDDGPALQAFATARAIAAQMESRGGLFVTVQDTGGDFGTGGRGSAGGLAALARTAAREWPAASVKAIDCERGGRSEHALAEAIVHELLCGAGDADVGLRADGTRVVPALVPTAAAPAASPFDDGDLIVATGGARGVTAAALIALAQTQRLRFVLIGRTPLDEENAALAAAHDEASLKRALLEEARSRGASLAPAEIGARAGRVLAAREVRATLDALQVAGSSARYLVLDAQDAVALAASLDAVRAEWGPVHGVVHGAGVLADRRIADKTVDQFERVYRTKVRGLRALLAATANDPLKCLCLFSSIAAHAGNVGQSDYAMANDVLNVVASSEAARRPGCVVRSIAWGAWQGGMVDAALAEHFKRQGVALIALDAGARAFVDELRSPCESAQVVIAAGLPAPPDQSPRAEVRASLASHPQLQDHCIDGRVVVPIALALEWMLRAARTPALRELRVLQKIGADAFDAGGALVLEVEAADGTLQLVGRGGAVHYRARCEAAAGDAQAWHAPGRAGSGLRGEVYDGRVLFHGPRFRAIRSVDGIDRDGAAATLVGVAALGWPDEPWCSDPALVDGALQLAVLWAEHVLGGATLPMALDAVRLHRRGAAAGPVQVVVRAQAVHESRASCDIGLVDDDGALRIELLGVELVMRPDAAAQRRSAERDEAVS